MKYTKTTLENGIRIISVPAQQAQSATFLIMTDTGSKYETKAESGLAHFLEHMMFKGTQRRPSSFDITKELDSVGAQYNAFTSQEYTGYYAKTAPEFLPIAFDVISDIYQNSLFNEKEIEKEKGVIIEEMRMYKDMPQRHIQDMFMSLLYGDTPAGRNIVGNEQTIRSFTAAHFLDYIHTKYTPASTIIGISGNFDEALFLEKIKNIFGALPKKEKAKKEAVHESQDKPTLEILEKTTDQTHIVLGFRTYGTEHADNTILKVLAGVLSAGMSSRLFMKLREEMGVGYYVHASNDVYTDHGIFSISAGVDTTRTAEVITVLLDQYKKLINELVTEEELARVKNNLIGGASLALEGSDAQAEFFVLQEVLRGRIESFEAMEQKIRAVTREDLMRLARTVFVEKNLNLALIGKGHTTDSIYPLLKL